MCKSISIYSVVQAVVLTLVFSVSAQAAQSASDLGDDGVINAYTEYVARVTSNGSKCDDLKLIASGYLAASFVKCLAIDHKRAVNGDPSNLSTCQNNAITRFQKIYAKATGRFAASCTIPNSMDHLADIQNAAASFATDVSSALTPIMNPSKEQVTCVAKKMNDTGANTHRQLSRCYGGAALKGTMVNQTKCIDPNNAKMVYLFNRAETAKNADCETNDDATAIKNNLINHFITQILALISGSPTPTPNPTFTPTPTSTATDTPTPTDTPTETPVPVDCGGSAPACDGTCDPGMVCESIDFFTCQCVPSP